jgi:signal peptidase II
MIRIVGLAGLVVVIDQVTKLIVLDRLPPGARVDVIDGLLALALVKNPGLAFGLLADLPTAWRWVAAALSIVALLILVRVALRVVPTASWLDVLAIGLIFGGAVGNLIDRARFGAVVDFIDVYYRDYHWPAFNAADSAITVGVVLLALRLVAREPSSTPR